MNNVKKISVVLLSAIAVILLISGVTLSTSVAAFAETGDPTEEVTYVASVTTADGGENNYDTLDGAVAAAQSGEKVTLLADVTLGEKLVLNKSLTLDLNGHTITHGGDKLLINNTGAEVVITDGSVENTGKIIQTATSGSMTSIWIKSAKSVTLQNFAVDSGDWGIYMASVCPVIIKNCTVESFIGLLVFGTGKVEVENSTFIGKSAGIMGNGNNHGTDISLTDCTVVTTDGAAIYHPQDGVLNVSGGSIEGKTGIEMRSGKLSVDGGAEIIATSDTYYTEPDGSGSTVSGAAVAISQHVTNKEIAVTINDATLTGIKALAQVDLQDIAEPAKVEISVNGGTFKGNISTERVDNFINGGNFSELPDSKYLAAGVEFLPDDNGGYAALSYEKAVAEVLAYAEKYSVALQDSHTRAIRNAIKADEFNAAVAEAKTYVDDLAKAKQEAIQYVMLYAAARNVEYTDGIAAILNDYVVVSIEDLAAVRSEAVAELDAAYAAKAELAQAKKDAIAEIKAAAAETEATATEEAKAAVVIPTATLAAINAAVDAEQVKDFKDNAIAEIDDIREYRKQISALDAKGVDILGAVTAFREALLGDGEEEGELSENLAATETALKAYLASVKDEINNYTFEELGKTKDALETKITSASEALDGAIRDSAEALTAKLSAVQNSVGYLVEAFGVELDEDSGKYVSGTLNDIKTMLAALENGADGSYDEILEQLGAANAAIKNANDTLAKALSDAETRLNEKLAALSAKADALTGKLNEVNGGLLSEINGLADKVAKLGSVSTDDLDGELAEIQTAIAAIAEKVQAAEDVEAEKSKATESINHILDELLSDEKADMGVAFAAEAAAASVMPASQRDKLYATYGKDKAELIEGYYGEAMTAVGNATTAAEARAAADNFGRNVETVKIVDGLQPETSVSLSGVYTLLTVAIILSAVAIVLAFVVLLKKRK